MSSTVFSPSIRAGGKTSSSTDLPKETPQAKIPSVEYGNLDTLETLTDLLVLSIVAIRYEQRDDEYETNKTDVLVSSIMWSTMFASPNLSLYTYSEIPSACNARD